MIGRPSAVVIILISSKIRTIFGRPSLDASPMIKLMKMDESVNETFILGASIKKVVGQPKKTAKIGADVGQQSADVVRFSIFFLLTDRRTTVLWLWHNGKIHCLCLAHIKIYDCSVRHSHIISAMRIHIKHIYRRFLLVRTILFYAGRSTAFHWLAIGWSNFNVGFLDYWDFNQNKKWKKILEISSVSLFVVLLLLLFVFFFLTIRYLDIKPIDIAYLHSSVGLPLACFMVYQRVFHGYTFRTRIQIDVYTIFNRIKLTKWTICAFPVLNPQNRHKS